MGVPASTKDWIKSQSLRNLVLLDSEGKVVSQYGVGTYTCFVLYPHGIIRYKGPVEGAADALTKLLENPTPSACLGGI